VKFTIVWPCIVTDSLWIRPTDALNYNFIVITTVHVSGSLSAPHQEFLAVHRLWYTLCSFDHLLPRVGWYCSVILLLGSKRSQLRKVYQSRCTAKNSWWWAERLPETCRVVIPIKLEFSASVGLIHKEVFKNSRKTRTYIHQCSYLAASVQPSSLSGRELRILNFKVMVFRKLECISVKSSGNTLPSSSLHLTAWSGLMTERLIVTCPLAENWENSISQLTDLSQSRISGAWKVWPL
jgi:hypothetical protein